MKEAIASVAVGVFVVVTVIGQLLYGAKMVRKHGRTPLKKRVSPGEWLVRIPGAFLLGFWIAFVSRHHPLPWIPGWVRWLGIPVMIGGLTMSVIAQRQLGRFWVGGVGIYQGHQLIQDGLYGIVRHPMYLGLAIGFVGVALTGASWATTCGSACLILALYVRTPQEEQVLQQKFPRKYLVYRARVPGLVPRWRRRT